MIRIGILTYHRAKNYGAFLQSYALCSRLNQEENIEAKIIDFDMKKAIDFYNEKYSFIERIFKKNEFAFHKELIKSFEKSYRKLELTPYKLCDDQIEKLYNRLNSDFDIIITGSDEIWKVDGFRGFPTPYWMPFNFKGKKVSYAASSRTDLTKYDEDILKKIRELVNDYTIVSVRDKKTYTQFKDIAGIEKQIFIMPDPTLTYDFNVDKNQGYSILSSIPEIDNNKKNALIMTGDDRIVKMLKKLYGKNYNFISVFTYHKGCINLPNITPFDWINLISAVDFIFTSYFHALCFSIKENKNYLIFGTPGKSDKTLELLNDSNNSERFIEFNNNTRSVDIDQVYKRCLKEKNNSEYLQKCKDKMNEYIYLITA